MKKITVKDVRAAIMYVCQNDGINLDKVSDEELLNSDFVRDFNVGNVRFINIVCELQKVHDFSLPYGLLRQRADDTVKSLLDIITAYLSKQW